MWAPRTVLGSGDLFSAQACLDMIRQTGVDGVTVARGAIGNPWIFQQARDLAAGRPLPPPPTVHQQRDVIREHYRLAEELYGERYCGPLMRKFGIKYSALHPQHEQVRDGVYQDPLASGLGGGLGPVVRRRFAGELPCGRGGRLPDGAIWRIIGDMANSAEQLDTTIEIVTPENIAFDYRVAGPFRRFPAYLIDLGIRFGIVALMWIGLSVMAGIGGGPLAVAIGLIAMFLLEWFYGGLFETYMNGQTPGKRVMGIRVLTVDGQPINGLQAVLRNILRTVDLYPDAVAGDVRRAGAGVHLADVHGRPGGDDAEPPVPAGGRSGVRHHGGDRRAALADRRGQAGGRAGGAVGRVRAAGLSRQPEPGPQSGDVRRAAAILYPRHGAGKSPSTWPNRCWSSSACGGDTSHDLLLCALYYRTFVADRAADTLPTGLRGDSPFGRRP